MITTITGSNDFLRLTEIRRLLNEFSKEYGDMSIERIDGNEVDFERLHDAMQSLPFLTPRKLVILDSPSQQKFFTEKVEDLLKLASDDIDVAIVEPKLDKRSSYYRVLKSKTTFSEFGELDSNDLSSWAVAYAQEKDGKLSRSDAQFLINRVGINQELLKNEIDKLLLYDANITKETIELLCETTPQSTIFELLDAALSGEKDEMQRLYREQRALKVEPQQIIAMLAWQLHILAMVKTAGDMSPDELAKVAKISPFVVRKSMGLSNRFSFGELKKIVGDILKLDVRLKTESLDPDEALQYYLLSLKI